MTMFLLTITFFTAPQGGEKEGTSSLCCNHQGKSFLEVPPTDQTAGKLNHIRISHFSSYFLAFQAQEAFGQHPQTQGVTLGVFLCRPRS